MRVVVFAFMCLTSAGASAAVLGPTQSIYDNFGPASAHLVNSGRAVLGSGYPTQQMLAVRFTPAASGFDITEVDVAGRHVAGSTSVAVWLASDGGGIPGDLLNLIGIVNFPGGAGDANGSYEAANTLVPLPVVGGTPYWIELLPGTSTSDSVWDGAPASLPGDLYDYDFSDGAGWQQAQLINTASLRVVGVPLPEPGATAAVLTACAIVARRRRHHL